MRQAAFFLFFLSGAVALLYEVVWLRLLVLVFGSTHFAVTAVLTAFMAGLAFGSFLFGRIADRTARHPLMVYGVLEIGIGVSAALVFPLLRVVSPITIAIAQWATGSFYIDSFMRFLLSLVLLAVPTTLMGGTLPVLGRFVTRRPEEAGGAVGWLYGLNTFGAVAGTLLTGFVLVSTLGVQRTTMVATAANLVLGLVSIGLAWRDRRSWEGPRLEAAHHGGGGRASGRVSAGKRTFHGGQETPSRAVLWAIGVSGLLALVYEIAWTRVLALVLGSSVYAFTCMLATFLVGLAAGASCGAWLAGRLVSRAALLKALTGSIGCAAAGGYATFRLLPRLPSLFAATFHQFGLGAADLADAGGRAVRLMALEFGLAFLVMVPATLFMGMVFPLVVRLWMGRLDVVGRSVGTVYAANTTGTIFGAVLGGFVILPLAGLKGGLLTAVVGGVLLAAAMTWTIPDWGRGRRLTATLAALGCSAWLVAARPVWDPLVMNSGIFQYAPELGGMTITPESFAAAQHDDMELLYYEEGMTANVLVARQRSNDNIWLSINGKIDASSRADIETQLLLGHLPMLVGGADDPAGRHVAVVGYASGITTGAVTRHHPAGVTAVEIEPAVMRASRFFDDVNHRPLTDPSVRVVENDGRSFLLTDPAQYDAIISEPSNPWMTIAANLFTREFFEIGRRRLGPGGVFSQWMQLYGLRPPDLRSLVGTFANVFADVAIFWSIPGRDIVLLGSDRPLAIDRERLAGQMAAPDVAGDLARIGIREVEDLLVYYLMGDAQARAFAADAPLNTDDNARIEFSAPLSLHVDSLGPNTAALEAFAIDPLSAVADLPEAPAARADLHTRLARAFFRKQLYDRAIDSLEQAQALHPTEEGALRLASYQDARQQREAR